MNEAKRSIDVFGIGNGIMDILLELSEEEFQRLKLDKGTMRLVEVDEQQQLIRQFGGLTQVLCGGGSAANSLVALAQLGGKGAFACSLGDDEFGQQYLGEFRDLGIEVSSALKSGEVTGTCVSLVTPDAERTMRTSLGVAGHVSTSSISPDIMKRSRWFFIEGYLLANPEGGLLAIREGVKQAKQHGTKIALTCSEPWVVESCRSAVEEICVSADLVFCNEEEAYALSGKTDLETAFSVLSEQLKNVIITGGPRGAYVSYEGQKGKVEAFPVEPIDVTGAGDMFAGSVLYGISAGVPPLRVARAACFMASKVICQMGARLDADLQSLWKHGLKS